jgi:FkbM family methyltransferase
MSDTGLKAVVRSLLPRAIRPRRIRGGPLRGSWLVTSWHDYPAGLSGRTERPLLDWFEAHVRPGETWLDVGAHYGYTAFALARLVGSAGRVFAFEPMPATAGCIDQARALNRFTNVTVLPYGLGNGDTLETRRLPTIRGMADSTLHEQSGDASVTASFARFDWLWPIIAGSDRTVHGVKIDVQGMELETLAGMQEALSLWHPRLVLELHAGVDRQRVLGLLRDAGYSGNPVAIEPAASTETATLLDNCSYAFC